MSFFHLHISLLSTVRVWRKQVMSYMLSVNIVNEQVDMSKLTCNRHVRIDLSLYGQKDISEFTYNRHIIIDL